MLEIKPDARLRPSLRQRRRPVQASPTDRRSPLGTRSVPPVRQSPSHRQPPPRARCGRGKGIDVIRLINSVLRASNLNDRRCRRTAQRSETTAWTARLSLPVRADRPTAVLIRSAYGQEPGPADRSAHRISGQPVTIPSYIAFSLPANARQRCCRHDEKQPERPPGRTKT